MIIRIILFSRGGIHVGSDLTANALPFHEYMRIILEELDALINEDDHCTAGVSIIWKLISAVIVCFYKFLKIRVVVD